MFKLKILFIWAILLAIAQGAWAQTEVASESALKDALGGSSPISIRLTADIALTERVAIPEGKTVTLDLNGHTLQRTEETYHWYYMVIHLLGNATMAAKRKYPVGIQSFESLRTDGYLYVDKTPLYPLTPLP